jgi:TetR/AcrR family transcriptional repressor of nem operon
MMRSLAELYPFRSKKQARSEAVRAAALMVGAAMLARAVDDPDLSDEILREAREALAQRR